MFLIVNLLCIQIKLNRFKKILMFFLLQGYYNLKKY